jgi:outer membrane protein
MGPAAEMEYIFVYMKRFLLILLTSISLILVGDMANAQVKIGYIDLKALIAQMPEAKEVKKQVDAYQQQFVDQLTAMMNEYTSSWPCCDGYPKMTDSLRKVIGEKLQAIQKKMQDVQDDAVKKVEAKSKELYKAVSDKAISALTEIAKENGISYVIDSSKGTRLIIASDGTDLMAAAKVKLGIR